MFRSAAGYYCGMRNFLAATLAVLAGFTLVACGQEESSLRTIENATEVRDRLEGTDYRCEEWTPAAGKGGFCRLPGKTGALHISLIDEPAKNAEHELEAFDEPDSFLVGDNWLADCEDGDTITGEDCQGVADILGADVISR